MHIGNLPDLARQSFRGLAALAAQEDDADTVRALVLEAAGPAVARAVVRDVSSDPVVRNAVIRSYLLSDDPMADYREVAAYDFITALHRQLPERFVMFRRNGNGNGLGQAIPPWQVMVSAHPPMQQTVTNPLALPTAAALTVGATVAVAGNAAPLIADATSAGAAVANAAAPPPPPPPAPAPGTLPVGLKWIQLTPGGPNILWPVNLPVPLQTAQQLLATGMPPDQIAAHVQAAAQAVTPSGAMVPQVMPPSYVPPTPTPTAPPPSGAPAAITSSYMRPTSTGPTEGAVIDGGGSAYPPTGQIAQTTQDSMNAAASAAQDAGQAQAAGAAQAANDLVQGVAPQAMASYAASQVAGKSAQQLGSELGVDPSAINKDRLAQAGAVAAGAPPSTTSKWLVPAAVAGGGTILALIAHAAGAI